MPLNARDAMRGSPSPWNVLAKTPIHANVKESRLICSARLRAVVMVVVLPRDTDGDACALASAAIARCSNAAEVRLNDYPCRTRLLLWD